MTDEDKKLITDILLDYWNEHCYDLLSMDEKFNYYDLDDNGNISYDTIDAKEANQISHLISLLN